MKIEITDPEVQRQIEEHIRSGRFTTPEEVATAALLNFAVGPSTEDDDFDDAFAQKLQVSLEQARHGEAMSIHEAANRLEVTLAQRKGKSGAA
jgi:hypothetical protein